MPSRADLEAAVPRCPTNRRFAAGRCDKPMRWSVEHGMWCCPVHGRVLTAQALVRLQTAA